MPGLVVGSWPCDEYARKTMATAQSHWISRPMKKELMAIGSMIQLNLKMHFPCYPFRMLDACTLCVCAQDCLSIQANVERARASLMIIINTGGGSGSGWVPSVTAARGSPRNKHYYY